MSIRDLLARQPQVKRPATPAQAHLRAILAEAQDFMRTKKEPLHWESLGSGYFSHVYGVDASTVVKTGGTLDGGYVYAMWALANQHLEGVPRIYAVQKVARRYSYSTTTYYGYVVVMERLEELSKSNWGDMNDIEQRRQYEAVQAANYGDDNSCPAAAALVRLRHDLNQQIQAGRPNRGPSGGYGVVDTQYFDIHNGNVMMRGNVMVLTDPIATIRAKTRGKFSRKRYEALRAYC